MLLGLSNAAGYRPGSRFRRQHCAIGGTCVTLWLDLGILSANPSTVKDRHCETVVAIQLPPKTTMWNALLVPGIQPTSGAKTQTIGVLCCESGPIFASRGRFSLQAALITLLQFPGCRYSNVTPLLDISIDAHLRQ